MLLRYNKSTESRRYNDVENSSTEVSWGEHPEFAKEIAEHLPVVLLTK